GSSSLATLPLGFNCGFISTSACGNSVQYLATYSYRHGSGKEKKALTYSDLSNTAEESETFHKYLKMLKEKRGEEENNKDESEDDEAES
ncbi:hypothetical protein FD755_005276, partial [Muntiacus reevesi]